ncbi:MAG TPA: bifunctional DNA-binding transcriptional regulator/O6-methylguanine-DNA methyltransferase Ada [Acidimicrobiales bacterium]|nr:bifunctional DNA-binding transcriptional regulator/O6-methylguanine-DNA methyltransferase Ada [Acidimicrobiales bacterium]
MSELDEVRWRAVRDRDGHLDGVMVYAVRTTGVSCRPGCSSRTPLRRNVEFFATFEEAAASGYRACRRCRPDQPRPVDPLVRAVVALCRHLERDEPGASVAELATGLGYSERHLRRAFVSLVGVPIGAYTRAQRAQRLRRSLAEGAGVTAAGYEAGFASSRALYEHGARRLGMAPSRYAQGGRGERIGYTSLESPIGVVLAARTERGVCFVQVGPREDALVRALRSEFEHASIERDDESLAGLAAVLAGAVCGEGDAARLPLDVAATAFQARVWQALREIPVGTTMTYSEVAASIGAPRAVRAVASACAANTVALAIPCHRVVRRDGSLGGYRWGVEAKETLLRAERARIGGAT